MVYLSHFSFIIFTDCWIQSVLDLLKAARPPRETIVPNNLTVITYSITNYVKNNLARYFA